MRRADVHFQVRQARGERRFDPGPQLLLDAPKDLAIPERRRRQRSDQPQDGAPLEKEPAEVDALADDGAVL
jgi:hypothetical protein